MQILWRTMSGHFSQPCSNAENSSWMLSQGGQEWQCLLSVIQISGAKTHFSSLSSFEQPIYYKVLTSYGIQWNLSHQPQYTLLFLLNNLGLNKMGSFCVPYSACTVCLPYQTTLVQLTWMSNITTRVRRELNKQTEQNEKKMLCISILAPN